MIGNPAVGTSDELVPRIEFRNGLLVIRCKRCGENVPAMGEALPPSWSAVKWQLCSEHSRYLPTDVFQGRASNDGLRPVRHPCAAPTHLSSLVSYLRKETTAFGAASHSRWL